MHDQLQSAFLTAQRSAQIRAALAEDLGLDNHQALNNALDITAQLVDATTLANARIVTRENMVLCGRAWVDEVFAQIDSRVAISWFFNDGDEIAADKVLCEIKGPARALLTGERCALNFLQTLSGTATFTRHINSLLPPDGRLQLLDTRKTIPGLRAAQKYAVRIGGGHNHRIGLFDAFLIKENHIAACGSIAAAIGRAREIAADKPVEIEVENFTELQQALDAGADIIMLDEFADDELNQAVQLTAGRARLEVSGNVSAERLARIAHTGVDFVSMGALTKHLRAIDLSMRVQWS